MRRRQSSGSEIKAPMIWLTRWDFKMVAVSLGSISHVTELPSKLPRKTTNPSRTKPAAPRSGRRIVSGLGRSIRSLRNLRCRGLLTRRWHGSGIVRRCRWCPSRLWRKLPSRHISPTVQSLMPSSPAKRIRYPARASTHEAGRIRKPDREVNPCSLRGFRLTARKASRYNDGWV